MYRIVIVDDEPWGLKGLSNIVNWEEYGFEVVALYSSGAEALNGVRELRPDVLFTDYRMPEMNGIDLIMRVNELGFHVEYVIVSAYSDFEIARKAIYYDTCNYILKPLKRDEIIDTLRKLSDRLEKRENPAEPIVIDPDRRDAGFSAKLGILAKRAVGRPFIALALGSFPFDIDFFADIPKSVIVTPLEIKSYGPGAIISSAQSSNREIYNLLKERIKPIGVSRLHMSLDSLRQMALEARASLRGSFGYEDNNVVSEIQYYIGSNFDKKLTVRDIANAHFLNETYLCEIFKKHTRHTVNTFITKTRMSYAAALLENHEISVKQVAAAIGFNDTSYFGKQFKRCFGKTPDKYRKLVKEGRRPVTQQYISVSD